MSIIINRIMKATLSDQDGVEYKVMFPENDNYFRFLPMLSRLAGNTTQKIEKLTVDNIVIPCELFNKDVLGKHFNLKADVVVGQGIVYVYELQTDIIIDINAYSAKNITPLDNSHYISIAPLQIKIPAYHKVVFKEKV